MRNITAGTASENLSKGDCVLEEEGVGTVFLSCCVSDYIISDVYMLF